MRESEERERTVRWREERRQRGVEGERGRRKDVQGSSNIGKNDTDDVICFMTSLISD